jgi:hypothetical protein
MIMLLGLGCPKQAFAKIATPRHYHFGKETRTVVVNIGIEIGLVE